MAEQNANIQINLENLAEKIHELTCHYNHTEQCFWFYEKEWNGSTHSRYLRAARMLEARTKESPVVLRNTLNELYEVLQRM